MNAPWITERLRQMDMGWRENIPDPLAKHLPLPSQEASWHAIPVHLPEGTDPSVVALRDEALRLALDYWDLAHVHWRLRTNIPLRPGDPADAGAVEERMRALAPGLRAACAAFRAAWQPYQAEADRAAARGRTAARRRARQTTPTHPGRPSKPVEEMGLDEYLAYLFPPS